MFIYLNRTGYNGLFRLNSQGDFNVPVGRYAAPRICDEPTLRAVAAVLRSPSVTLHHRTFAAVAASAGPGDLVYFDPPYAPLSATARFTSYTAGNFSEKDQRALQEVVVELAGRGCAVVVSNSTADVVSQLYGRPKRAGPASRLTASPRGGQSTRKAAHRGTVDEYIISNVGLRVDLDQLPTSNFQLPRHSSASARTHFLARYCGQLPFQTSSAQKIACTR